MLAAITTGISSHLFCNVHSHFWLRFATSLRHRAWKSSLLVWLLGFDEVILENLSNFSLLVLNHFAHIDEKSKFRTHHIGFRTLMCPLLPTFLLVLGQRWACITIQMWMSSRLRGLMHPCRYVFYVIRRWLLYWNWARAYDFTLSRYLFNSWSIRGTFLPCHWMLGILHRDDTRIGWQLLCIHHLLLERHDVADFELLLLSIFILHLNRRWLALRVERVRCFF